MDRSDGRHEMYCQGSPDDQDRSVDAANSNETACRILTMPIGKMLSDVGGARCGGAPPCSALTRLSSWTTLLCRG